MVAPTPVSSLLHAVAVVKSGIFSIIRLTFFIVGANIILITHDNIYLSILIGLTILLGSLLALHQDNLKKRLAYSTISQLGYILLGIVLLNENGLIGGILHLVNHAVIKITMFFCAGAIMYTSGKKNISEIAGIGKRMPITMWCFGIASISLIGLPPTNGFVSKWYLALGGLDSNRALFVVILLASALLTASYLIPIITRAFFGKEEIQMEAPAVNSHNEHAGDRTHDIHGVITDPPFKMLMPIVVLTGINIFLGIFPNILIDFIKNIVGDVI